MQTTNKPLVLIIEDDALIARMIGLMLATQGYRTHVATNAEAALRDLSAMQPDLITLDINLPGMSGNALLQQLRAMAHTADLPVVIISALQDIPKKTLQLADGALIKPFEMDTLLTLVSATLARDRSLLTKEVGQPAYIA